MIGQNEVVPHHIVKRGVWAIRGVLGGLGHEPSAAEAYAVLNSSGHQSSLRPHPAARRVRSRNPEPSSSFVHVHGSTCCFKGRGELKGMTLYHNKQQARAQLSDPPTMDFPYERARISAFTVIIGGLSCLMPQYRLKCSHFRVSQCRSSFTSSRGLPVAPV